jgi:pimeloyl-ACP methyl ester carboxylesterase
VQRPQQRGEVLIDGKRLETLWIGPAARDRPTIVMLHEGLGSVALWKDFPQHLASRTGCGVFAYSRYGHGNSDRLLEKRHVEFMHHEGEVVLYPDRPRGLILGAPHVFVEDLSVSSITQAKVAYVTTDLPRKLGKYHQHVDATFWGWNDIWLDPQFRSWNIEEYLPAILCPILCIQGEEDEYGTSAQVKAVQARVPATEIIMLPNCKHSPHRDQAEVTLEWMAEFVAEVEGSEESAAMRDAAEAEAALPE